jgi:Holliday junction resolvase RusA-like endonuclease
MTAAPLTFSVPGVFPSLNALNKMHWRKRHQIRKDTEWSIRVHTGTPEKRSMGLTAVDIVIYQPFRRLDEDNAQGSMKSVIDSLVAIGLIFRDSPTWLRKTITQKIDRANPRVEIMIREIKEGV